MLYGACIFDILNLQATVMTCNKLDGGGLLMAKTKTSVRGTPTKKIVVVKPYTKSNGTRVGGHRRSTPN